MCLFCSICAAHFFCMWRNVCLPNLCGILLLSNRHPSVCYLSKLKAPVVFGGASGRKRHNWAITPLLSSSQRCSAPLSLPFLPGGLCRQAFPFLPLGDFYLSMCCLFVCLLFPLSFTQASHDFSFGLFHLYFVMSFHFKD